MRLVLEEQTKNLNAQLNFPEKLRKLMKAQADCEQVVNDVLLYPFYSTIPPLIFTTKCCSSTLHVQYLLYCKITRQKFNTFNGGTGKQLLIRTRMLSCSGDSPVTSAQLSFLGVEGSSSIKYQTGILNYELTYSVFKSSSETYSGDRNCFKWDRDSFILQLLGTIVLQFMRYRIEIVEIS